MRHQGQWQAHEVLLQRGNERYIQHHEEGAGEETNHPNGQSPVGCTESTDIEIRADIVSHGGVPNSDGVAQEGCTSRDPQGWGDRIERGAQPCAQTTGCEKSDARTAKVPQGQQFT